MSILKGRVGKFLFLNTFYLVCWLKICKQRAAEFQCPLITWSLSFWFPGQRWRDDGTAAQHHHFLRADWFETRGGVYRQLGGAPRSGSKSASHRHHLNMYVWIKICWFWNDQHKSGGFDVMIQLRKTISQNYERWRHPMVHAVPAWLPSVYKK